jgi:hypothetical protein
MCWLCRHSPDGSTQCCQDCGCLICFDFDGADDTAYVTASGNLYCSHCGRAHDRAEEKSSEDEYDDGSFEVRRSDVR